MPIIGKRAALELDSIIFATDFSPASQNAGLYASAISAHFGISLVIAHAFTLVQAALEVEAEKPLASQQRANLNYELMLTAKILDAGQQRAESILLEGDPCKVIPVLAQRRFLDVGNYRYRVLKPLADKLGIPKLNFQVLRRTMATQAQNMGSVKDIQAHLRHAKADTTANEYMQALPESVQGMVGSMYLMLEKGGEEKTILTICNKMQQNREVKNPLSC